MTLSLRSSQLDTNRRLVTMLSWDFQGRWRGNAWAAWASREFCQKGGDIWTRTRRQRKGNEGEGILSGGNGKAIKVWSNTRLRFLRTYSGPGVLSVFMLIVIVITISQSRCIYLYRIWKLRSRKPKSLSQDFRHSEGTAGIQGQAVCPRSSHHPTAHCPYGESWVYTARVVWCGWSIGSVKEGSLGSERSFHASTAERWRQAEQGSF